MRRRAALCWFLLALLAGTAAAQSWYFPYYGKSRVLYGRFPWKSYPTDHFRLYYYIDDPQMLKDLASLAESAYLKVSRVLKHEVSEPVILLHYKTYTDFEQSNVFSVSEGILGVTELALHRIGIHGDMPIDELAALIEHELTHVFELDILYGSPGASLYAVTQPPLWVFEGLAEYTTGKWTTWSALVVRDAVLNDRLPMFTPSGDISSSYPTPRDPAYDFGHAVYEFIRDRFGDNAIREFLTGLKTQPLLGRRDPLKRAFNMTPKEFNQHVRKYLREKEKAYLLRENPEDYSITLGPEFPLNPYFYSFSHDLSPSGDLAATVTASLRDYDIDLVLISTKDGSVVKNITRGFSRAYEYIQFQADPTLGRNLDWSPDGDRIAFFGRDREKYSLLIISPMTGEVLQKTRLTFDQPSSPTFTPDGSSLLCAGFTEGRHDLFRIDLADGRATNLTQDRLYEKAPVVSPDGRTVAYSVRVGEEDKLFLSPLEDLSRKTQISFGPGNTIAPQFSADSREVFYSGDQRGAYNLYSVNLDSGEVKRYTDVRTGNFFPAPMPGEPGTLVFAGFNKGSFQLFRSAFTPVVEETLTFAEAEPGRADTKPFQPLLAVEINQDKVQVQKGLGKLFLTERPPVDFMLATDGSLFGGSALAFSDVLGNHNIYFLALQTREGRSYFGSYVNLKHRFQYMLQAYQYSLFYYPPLSYYDPVLYNYLTYQDALAVRKIFGASAMGIYPFSMFHRLELSLGISKYTEDFIDPYLFTLYSQGSYSYFWNKYQLAASLAFVGETTRFKQYGPALGSTYRLALTQPLPLSSNFISNTTLELDARKYLPLGYDFLIAGRFNAVLSRGRDPYVSYWGGNNQVRASNFYNIVGTEGWFANLEFRFPLVSVANTILGQIGPVRGVLFADLTRSKIKGYEALFYETYDPFGVNTKTFEALGSYGYGIQFFLFGLPMHLEVVGQIKVPRMSRFWKFETAGTTQTKFWIGFDF